MAEAAGGQVNNMVFLGAEARYPAGLVFLPALGELVDLFHIQVGKPDSASEGHRLCEGEAGSMVYQLRLSIGSRLGQRYPIPKAIILREPPPVNALTQQGGARVELYLAQPFLTTSSNREDTFFPNLDEVVLLQQAQVLYLNRSPQPASMDMLAAWRKPLTWEPCEDV